MENHHLRHFLAVADTGSLTRAAEQLGIAQPALSQSIKRMESLIGVKLFERSRRGATLTAAGAAIVDDVRVGLERIDAARMHARDIAQGLAGTLVVAFVASAVYELLPRALRRYRARVPNVRFVLREMGNTEQVRAFAKGEIDVGLLYTPVDVPGRMKQRVLARDRLIAVVPERFPVGEDGKVALRDMAREGLVIFPQDQAPVMRAQIIGAVHRLGEEARIVQEANRTLTVLACVAAGLGVSLLPSSTRRLAFDGVRYCEVRERGLLPTLELSALWPASSRPTLAEAFGTFLASTR